MGFKATDIFAPLILNLIHCAYSEHILSCAATFPNTCPGRNQVCNLTSHECYCLRGFVRVGDDCQKPDSNGTSSQGATVAIVALFTLALVTCGLVLVVKKYKLVDYIRQKINMRRNNDVMYEDVMIGQDDPPLSP